MTKEAQSSCDNLQLKIQQIINILFTDLNVSVFWDCYSIKWGLLRQDICDLFAELLTKKPPVKTQALPEFREKNN